MSHQPFTKDANGDALRPASFFDSYHANVKLSPLIPAVGTPQNTHGTRIFSGTLQVPEGRGIEIEVNLTVLHASGTNAMVICWFVDNETNARGSWPINHIGSGYLSPHRMHDLYVPGDDLPHTIHIHVGAAAGQMVLNGSDPALGPLLFGGTISSNFFLKEF